jgi:hypothetical protein
MQIANCEWETGQQMSVGLWQGLDPSYSRAGVEDEEALAQGVGRRQGWGTVDVDPAAETGIKAGI